MCQSDLEDVEFLKVALELAQLSADEGEVPVGAVVVKDGCIISRGRNHRESYGNALAHAELEAINEACTQLGGWQLVGCTLYVTLEPCDMCKMVIKEARIKNVYYLLSRNSQKKQCSKTSFKLINNNSEIK